MTYKTLPLPARSTKETRAYAQAVEKGLESYFVVQNGKGWYARKASVRKGNGMLFATKTKAVGYASKQAQKNSSEVLVFDRMGQLLERRTK